MARVALNFNDSRIRATCDDMADIAHFVAANTNHDFGPRAIETVAVAMDLSNNDAIDAWGKLAGWVVWVTNFNERHRPLTAEEQRMRRIATRLSQVMR